MLYSEVEDELAHFGVKGMKWGVRKAQPTGSKRLSRKEVRKINKEGQTNFYLDRANRAFATAQQDPSALIRTRTNLTSPPMVLTGKDFVDHLLRGGTFDIKMTAIYATKSSENGQYVVDEHLNDRYVPIKR